MEETDFDVIVLGAGPAGKDVADRVVKGGRLKGAIVESYLVGGECSFFACVPSKVLLRSSAPLEAARRVDGAKQAITGSLDSSAVFARRIYFTSSWNDTGKVEWLKDSNIPLVRGKGRLTGERVVEVQAADGSVTRPTEHHAVVICTGTAPLLPPIPGLADGFSWTNREAKRAERVPPRLVVLGGGLVRYELGQAFLSLGAKNVTLFDLGDRLLERFGPFVGEKIAAHFRKLGIRAHTHANVTRVQRRSPGSPVQIWFDTPNAFGGAGPASIEAEEILVASGRMPNTRGFGLETISLKPRNWLDVDGTLRVKSATSGCLYAAGDTSHRARVTHMGKYQARVCSDAIVARAKGELKEPFKPWTRFAATADHAAVPQVVFTDPEAAPLGLTEAQAKDAGLRGRSVEYDFGRVSGAEIVADGYHRLAKKVVDEERRFIVGATRLGRDVGELIHAFTVAVAGEERLDRLWHAVPRFPTMSEIWLRLRESYGL